MNQPVGGEGSSSLLTDALIFNRRLLKLISIKQSYVLYDYSFGGGWGRRVSGDIPVDPCRGCQSRDKNEQYYHKQEWDSTKKCEDEHRQ